MILENIVSTPEHTRVTWLVGTLKTHSRAYLCLVIPCASRWQRRYRRHSWQPLQNLGAGAIQLSVCRSKWLLALIGRFHCCVLCNILQFLNPILRYTAPTSLSPLQSITLNPKWVMVCDEYSLTRKVVRDFEAFFCVWGRPNRETVSFAFYTNYFSVLVFVRSAVR